MTEKDAESRPSAEMLGGVVILLGAIPAFAIAMALKKGIDATTPDVGGIARLATGMMGAAGKWPAFLASAGVAFIGAAIFVGVVERDRVRAIIGTVVASLGLAALMSALSPGAGGSLGDATGGRLAAGLGAWAGVGLGVVVALGAVWLGWLQGRVALPEGLASRLQWPSFRLPALPRRADKVRAKQRARETVEPARFAAALTHVDTELDGVSAAEANALAPDEKTLRYMEEVWRRAADGHAQVAPMPPSPYPVDVRLRGEIPPGAKPLGAQPAGASAQRPPGPGAASPAKGRGKGEVRPVDAGSQFSWQPEPRPRPTQQHPAGEELDPFVLGGGAGFDEEEARALADAIRREGAIVAPPSPYPPGVRPLGSPRSAPPDVPAGRHPGRTDGAEALAPSTLPPRPTWEQDELAELDDEVLPFASEPAVAAGGRSAWAATEAAVEFDEEELDEDLDETDEDVESELEEDESEAVDEAADELEEEDELEEDDDEEDEDDEVEDEDDADEDVEEEAEVEAEAGGDDNEGWIEEDEDEEDDEAEDDDEEEDEDEVEDTIDSTPLPALGANLVVADAPTGDAATFAADGLEYVEVDEPTPAPVAAKRANRPTPPLPPVVAPPAAPRRGGRRKQSAELDFGPASERQVTLQPAAPQSARAATLHRAGALFVHEGRVAVSLLQRQLGLEFDDACTILDELQEAGLIGPYKGGQKRDILLTAEEWAARCATS
jgi:DNA segregation ATPase FtsK/SpoIIIE-like protein